MEDNNKDRCPINAFSQIRPLPLDKPAPFFGQRVRREPEGNLYIHTYNRPSLTSSSVAGPDLTEDRRTYGRYIHGGTDVWIYRFPCILKDCRCPAYITATITKYQSRARLPMTISCLWATGFNYYYHQNMYFDSQVYRMN